MTIESLPPENSSTGRSNSAATSRMMKIDSASSSSSWLSRYSACVVVMVLVTRRGRYQGSRRWRADRGTGAATTGPEVRTIGAVRAVVQRVSEAAVSVDGVVVGRCAPPPGGQGLLVLLGVTHDDTVETADRLAAKVWQLRILDDERSASDVGAPILVVSQFTLYADTRKGRRPSWSAAAPQPVSEPLVGAFVQSLAARGAHVETGVFGAMMQVSLVNDGPVTLLVEA